MPMLSALYSTSCVMCSFVHTHIWVSKAALTFLKEIFCVIQRVDYLCGISYQILILFFECPFKSMKMKKREKVSIPPM